MTHFTVCILQNGVTKYSVNLLATRGNDLLVVHGTNRDDPKRVTCSRSAAFDHMARDKCKPSIQILFI